MHKSPEKIDAIYNHSLIDNNKRYELLLTISQRVRDRNQMEKNFRVSKVLKEKIMKRRLDVFITSRVEKSYALLDVTEDQDSWYSFSSSAVTLVETLP
jgi:hypothetical protein